MHKDRIPAPAGFLFLLVLLVLVTGQNVPGATARPEQPTLTSVVNTSTGIKLTWKETKNTEFYEVKRASWSENAFKRVAVLQKGTTTFTDTRVTEGTGYSYTILAWNGPHSSTYDSYGYDILRLLPPTIQKIQNMTSGIRLKWSSCVGADGYVLYRKGPSDSSYRTLIRLEGDENCTYTDPDVVPGKKYYYRIKSYYKSSLSVKSSTAKLTRSKNAATPTPTPAPAKKGTFRALCVGESCYDKEAYTLLYPRSDADSMNLYAAIYDVAVMKTTLKAMGCNTVKVKKNISASKILKAIASAFSDATKNDVSLFYYSGHGISEYGSGSGSLLTPGGTKLSLKKLATALEKIPGTIVVILDSCGSGAGLYTKSSESSFLDPALFNRSVIDAFRETNSGTRISTGELRNQKFYVLTGSAAYKDSTFIWEGSYYYGSLLTMGLVQGAGFRHEISIWNHTLPADTGGDGAISLEEAYLYADSLTHARKPEQDIQRYPIGSSFVLFQP